jgi:hypothetical protein
MRSIPRWAALLVIAVLVVPLWAAEDKKPDAKKDVDKPPDAKKDVDKPPPNAKKDLDKPPVNTEKSVKLGQLTGKVIAVVESKKSLRLQLTFQTLEYNQGAANNIAQATVNYQLAIARRDVNGAAQQQVYIAQQQANLYTPKTHHREIEIGTTEDVKVRRSNPPPKFDEKGKLVRHTAKELKELKGEGNLPGYSGEFSDLAAEQIVTVTLIRKKGDTPRPVKPKGKDADVDLLQDNLPQASMIVIAYDPNDAKGK